MKFKNLGEIGVKALLTIIKNAEKAIQTNKNNIDKEIAETKADLNELEQELIITDTATGTNITVTNSTDAKVRMLKVDGKTEQFTTTGKNLLSRITTTNTVNGVTFTTNEDLSLSFKGTATSNAEKRISNNVPISAGNYIFSIQNYDATKYIVNLKLIRNGSTPVWVEFGDEDKSFTINDGDTIEYTSVVVKSGATVDTTIYPMIRLAYGENLLKNTATTSTVNGVTFTVNNDGSITANGTASNNIDFAINANMSIGSGNYKLSGCPSGGSTSTYNLQPMVDGAWSSSNYDVGNGSSFTANTGVTKVILYVKSGTTLNNVVFRPAIHQAELTDGTYEPYTGGKPSPNTEFDQDIEGVGKFATTGKNLFDASKSLDKNATGGSGQLYQSESCFVSPFISIDSGETYTLSNALWCNFYDNDKTGLNQVGTSENPTFTVPANAVYLRFTGYIDQKDIIQLEKGVATSYEPYKEYADGAYLVDFTISGRNLLNIANNTKTVDGVEFKIEDGIISANGKATTYNSQINIGSIVLPAGKYVFSGGISTNVLMFLYDGAKYTYNYGTKVVVNITEEKKYNVFCKVNKDVTVNNAIFKAMLCKEEFENGIYEQPRFKTLSIPLPSPLYEGDTSTLRNEEIDICRDNGEIVFDGSEDEDWNFSSGNNNRCSIDIPNNKNTSHTVVDAYCNTFIYDSTVYNDTDDNEGFCIGQRLYIRFGSTSSVNTLELLRAYLAENPIKVVYKLANPVTETIKTDIDLSTYYHVTNITNADNANMEVEYFVNSVNGNVVGDLQEQINNLEAASNVYGVATSSTLGLVKSGTDITVDTNGNVSVNDDSHNHVISNIDGLQDALDGKAASNHGNHVPAKETANNAKFLRNDNTWQTVTPANIGAAPSSHTHDDRYYTESETDTKLNAKLNNSLKGAANGLAELDSNGKVPSSQLPSYVDDVIEGYYYNSKFYKESAHTNIITGETGKIYMDLATNKTYRWSGSTYVEISPSLALGETSSTAYRGDRGKTAYDHSQASHARTDATKTEASSTNGYVKINGTETKVYEHPSTAGNKHIPSGGSSGQILRWSSDGTAVWGEDKDTTYSNFVKSGSGAKSGLVPAPSTTAGTTKYLREDGTWAVPPDTNTTYSEATTSAAGLMSSSDKSKLNGIAPGANAYTHPTTAGNKHIPSGGSSGQYIKYGGSSGTGSWASFDSSLSETSTNAVQNKVIKEYLDTKAPLYSPVFTGDVKVTDPWGNHVSLLELTHNDPPLITVVDDSFTIVSKKTYRIGHLAFINIYLTSKTQHTGRVYPISISIPTSDTSGYQVLSCSGTSSSGGTLHLPLGCFMLSGARIFIDAGSTIFYDVMIGGVFYID